MYVPQPQYGFLDHFGTAMIHRIYMSVRMDKYRNKNVVVLIFSENKT